MTLVARLTPLHHTLTGQQVCMLTGSQLVLSITGSAGSGGRVHASGQRY